MLAYLSTTSRLFFVGGTPRPFIAHTGHRSHHVPFPPRSLHQWNVHQDRSILRGGENCFRYRYSATPQPFIAHWPSISPRHGVPSRQEHRLEMTTECAWPEKTSYLQLPAMMANITHASLPPRAPYPCVRWWTAASSKDRISADYPERRSDSLNYTLAELRKSGSKE